VDVTCDLSNSDPSVEIHIDLLHSIFSSVSTRDELNDHVEHFSPPRAL
jgi:hypothetical protein